MAEDVYPKYSLPSGGWTTDKERADRLHARARRLTMADLALLDRYCLAKDAWEDLVAEHGPAHQPGTPWPPAVTEAEARYDAVKAEGGEGQPGDPQCCQRYGRLHLPVFALPGCRWYPLRPARA